jgi:hypothetical protein
MIMVDVNAVGRNVIKVRLADGALTRLPFHQSHEVEGFQAVLVPDISVLATNPTCAEPRR